MSHAASQVGTGHKDPETARAHISVGTLGGASAPAHRDGTLSSSRFRSPMGIARMPGGRGVIVADTGNDAIREISLHDESSVRTLYGGRWLRPTDVSTCPDGFGYAVCDSGHHRISLLSSSGNTVTPLAGCGKMGFLDGTAPEARFHSPHGICYGPRGSLIIADSGNHVIRMLSNGFVTTIAGVPGVRGYADGRSNQALLDSPKRVLVTHDGSCDAPGLPTPAGLCDPGVFCSGASPTSAPGANPVAEAAWLAALGAPYGGVCPAGGYCPAGSSAAVPCPAGTYLNSTGESSQAGCLLCTPGSYCASTSSPGLRSCLW